MKYLVVDLKEVSDYVIAEVVQGRSNPDTNVKDRRIGFIFAIGAFVSSGRLVEAFSRPSTQSGTIQFVTRLVGEMVSNESLNQVPILELTVETLLKLLAQVPKQYFQPNLLPVLSKSLATTSDGLQPEIISLALGVQKLFGHNIALDNPQLWNKNETLFGAKNIRNLLLPLNVSVRTVPRVGAVFNHILDALLLPSPTQHDDFARFCSFILGSLLKLDSTDHTYLALSVTAHFLQRLSPDQVELLLTPELLNALFLAIPRRKSVVFPAAKSIVDTAVNMGKQNQDFALAVLRRLTGPYGDLTVLDHFVKPGIMHTLTQSLDEAHLTQYASEIFADSYDPAMPSDLVPRLEVVKTLDAHAPTQAANKGKKKNNESGMDIDDVPVPDETVDLREVHVDPAVWKTTRQEALVHHLQRVANWTYATQASVVRKILNTLYYQAFYKCIALPEDASAASNASGKQLKKKKSENKLVASPQASMLAIKNVDITEKVREQISTTLSQLFDVLKVPQEASETSAENGDQKKRKRSMSTVDHAAFHHAHYWILPVVQFEKSLLDDSLHFAPITHGSALDDIRSTAESLMARIEPVLKVSDEIRRTRLEAFQALLIHLHIMINVDLEDSIQSIQDLAKVFEELFMEDESSAKKKATPSKSASKKAEEAPEEHVPEAIEVFTEILVALLMKASRSLRQVIEQNWVAFASLIGERSLDIVLTAFEEEQPADDEDEDEDDEETLLDLAAGDLVLKLDDASGEGSEESEGEKSEGDDKEEGSGEEDGEDDLEVSSSEDDESDNEMDEVARKKFRAVLEAAGAYQGSDESSEEMDFDDAKMFELDVGLAKVVKELNNVKDSAKRKREHKMTPLELQASEFRIRLLSLIDLYVEQQTTHVGHHHVEPVSTPSKKGSTPSKQTPTKETSSSSPFHTVYLNVAWPLVRVADVIASKKSLQPLMTRVLASIHRLAGSKPHHAAALPEKQVGSLYSLLSHLYSGFSQPSRSTQVEVRLTLIVFLQKLLLQQPSPKIKKMKDALHAALKAYADSSQTAIKSRALFVDLYAHILKRNASLHLLLLHGAGEVLVSCREGPQRAALALSLYATISKGIVESTEAQSHGKVDFADIVKEFVAVFKTCFVDAKIKPIHKKDLLLRATELFKISLAVNDGDLAKVQKLWNTDALSKFVSSHVPSNSLPAISTAAESFLSFVQTGKAKVFLPKYASVEEKYKAKKERKLQRLAQQNAKQSAQAPTAAASSEAKEKKSKSAKPVAEKMDIAEPDHSNEKRKARKTTSSTLADSSSAPPTKKKAK